MTTASAAGLTPDLFGYQKCKWCARWRRPDGVKWAHGGGSECADNVDECLAMLQTSLRVHMGAPVRPVVSETAPKPQDCATETRNEQGEANGR